MEVIPARRREIGDVAAGAIELLTRQPDAVLGLATGSSPLPIYDSLVERCAAGRISFSAARGFTLDEYVGLPPDHPERYRNVIDTVFASRVDFGPGAVQGPDGLAADIPAACAAYEQAIEDARRDRPTDPRDRHRRSYRLQRAGFVVGLAHPDQTLTRQTRLDNARFFGDDIDAVPALSDPGPRHHHGIPARGTGGHRA